MSEKLLMCWYALAADVVIGDPRWLPHPVVAIGKLAKGLEELARATMLPLRTAGVLVWAAVLSVTAFVIAWTLAILPAPWVHVYWAFSFLAVRSLDDHARPILTALREQDLGNARRLVGYIVGRDTTALNETEILRATYETVAENLSDGVIAPLFWMLIGGPVAMGMYKAINTMDSMFGYRNERYLEFGWCAARMDDLANWIPARVTALLIVILALAHPALSAVRALKATIRDAHLQPSPNSGYPEAAAAGALGIQLGGANVYGGRTSVKAPLGERVFELSPAQYPKLRYLLYGSPVLLLLGVTVWK